MTVQNVNDKPQASCQTLTFFVHYILFVSFFVCYLMYDLLYSLYHHLPAQIIFKTDVTSLLLPPLSKLEKNVWLNTIMENALPCSATTGSQRE